MTSIQLLDLLTKRAKEYRTGANSSLVRNSHMHDFPEMVDLPQDGIDAVLTDFINYIGVNMGVDYALYSRDLTNPDFSPSKA